VSGHWPTLVAEGPLTATLPPDTDRSPTVGIGRGRDSHLKFFDDCLAIRKQKL
jgi:hypothetical protein